MPVKPAHVILQQVVLLPKSTSAIKESQELLQILQTSPQLFCLLLDKAIANRAFLTLVCDSVVEIVQLTFVTLVTHKALTTVAGTVPVTLHGNGAHRVTVTGSATS